MEKKFKELYLAGEIEFEAIDDYSYDWGMSDEECTLAEYLGLNEEEEDAWVSESEDALRELLDKQKKQTKPIAFAGPFNLPFYNFCLEQFA